MRRKVSLWIVIVLVGALAATTAAAVVLAQRDDGPDGPRADGRVASGWSYPGREESGECQGPETGSLARWGHEDQAPVLPWVLFALATGTAVGLLIAWSPWRAQPATVTAGPPCNGSRSGAQAGVADEVAAESTVTAEVDGDATVTKAQADATAAGPVSGSEDVAAEASDDDDAATQETPPQA